VRDTAALLDVMARPVPGDPFPLPAPSTSFLRWTERDPGRLRIARCAEPDTPEAVLDPEVRKAYEETSALLAELGHEVVEVPQPMRPGERRAFSPVWSVMAALAEVPEEREGELMPLSRWLRAKGRSVDGPGYARALLRLQAVGRRVAEAVEPYDAVLTPTLARLPAPVGALRDDADPSADFSGQVRFTPFTAVWNITGHPAISLPLCWTAEGLPVGMMLAGRFGGEGPLLALAAQLEAASPWHARRPACW
jgi:amidase